MKTLREILSVKTNHKSQEVADIVAHAANMKFDAGFKFVNNFDMIDEAGKFSTSLYCDIFSNKAIGINWDENDVFESISYWNDYPGSPLKPTKEVFLKESIDDTEELKKVVNAIFERWTTCREAKFLPEYVEFIDGRLLTEDTKDDENPAPKKKIIIKRSEIQANKAKANAKTDAASSDAEVDADIAAMLNKDKVDKKVAQIKAEKDAKKAAQEAEIHYADPDFVFKDIENSISMLCQGSGFYGVVIAGPGGTGKSYHVEKALADNGLKPGIDWIKFKTHMTPAQIYMALLQNYNKIVVFDDCDDALLNKTTANIFKAALETNGKRTIGWNKADVLNIPQGLPMSVVQGLVANDKKHRLPSQFTFEGAIIFITNLPIKKVDAAVLTRCDNIDVTLKTEDMAKLILQRLPDIKVSGFNRASGEEINIATDMELKLEVYNFIMSPAYQEHMQKYEIPLNMRLFQRAYAFAYAEKKNSGDDAVHADNANWKRRMFNIFN